MKELIGGVLGFIWFGVLTILLVGGLLFWWLSAMRPEAGEPRSVEQSGVCTIWKELGRPCD